MSITATPTLAPTPTPVPPTPTPDTRRIEKLFADSQQALLGGDWTLTIETLLILRKREPTYNAVQVDDMLYVALRYRGLDKIKGSGKTDATITKVDLEAGCTISSWRELWPVGQRCPEIPALGAVVYLGLKLLERGLEAGGGLLRLVANEAPYLVDVNGCLLSSATVMPWSSMPTNWPVGAIAPEPMSSIKRHWHWALIPSWKRPQLLQPAGVARLNREKRLSCRLRSHPS